MVPLSVNLNCLFPSRMLAKDELVALLQRCVEILQPVKSKKMKNAFLQLTDLLTKFKQLDSKSWKWRLSIHMKLFSMCGFYFPPFCHELAPQIILGNRQWKCDTCITLLEKLVFCLVPISSSCWASPLCGRTHHLSSEESSKENRSVSAAEGFYGFMKNVIIPEFLWRDAPPC